MLISKVSQVSLGLAMEAVNRLYNGNIRWKRFDQLNKAGTRFRVTLTVNNSHLPGSRRSHRGRRIAAACWHVHGEFFDALPKEAVIRLGREGVHRPGDPWKDQQVGSMFQPMMFSEACECGGRVEKTAPGTAKVKQVRQADMTAACFGVQVWGLTACSHCSYRNTDDCGGKEILDRIERGEFPKTGLPEAR